MLAETQLIQEDNFQMMWKQSASLLIFLLAGACTIGPNYTSPEASGLSGLRNYPAPDDICQVIGENELSSSYLDHTSLLIGCPVHEKGAIDDRLAEGAMQVGQVGAWVLLTVPLL